MNTEMMEQLAQRQHFARKFGVEYVDGEWPFLSVDSPIGVARIVGEAKHTGHTKGRVFVRGQKSHHDSMIPSLFRCGTSAIAHLRSAEIEFCDAIRDKIKVGRFKAGNTAALLQHYGFRTTWLDAVDNLFVAYWFASHEISLNADGYLKICETDLPNGWLYILHPPESVSVIDLRSEHHPLSSRPHVQHGVSIECPCDMDPDLRGYILATVRTPVAGLTGGKLLSGPFLFPPASADHTLSLILKHDINNIAAMVEESHKLPAGALGRTLAFRDES